MNDVFCNSKSGHELLETGERPNLLVNAISEHAKVPTPSFVGYAIKFAIPVLLPIFVLISFLFFAR
jgi:hypothetical protein